MTNSGEVGALLMDYQYELFIFLRSAKEGFSHNHMYTEFWRAGWHLSRMKWKSMAINILSGTNSSQITYSPRYLYRDE